MSTTRTIQLHAPRPMLYGAQEHLEDPLTKLLALERLMTLAGWTVLDEHDRLGDTSTSDRAAEAQQEGDVLLGLSRILRDVREEIQAIREADFERSEETPEPAPEPATAEACRP